MPPRTKGETRSATTVPSSSPAHDHTDEDKCGLGCPAYRDTSPAVERHREEAAVWAELTAPFPQDWVEKLPKVLRRDDQDKGRCEEGTHYTADGHACHGWHARAVHLDYVGHAGITERLNDILGPGGWDFQPYVDSPNGTPGITTGSGATFYARLTIMGVTKWDLAADYKGPQEAYGDALRRCAMRFGIGTYLWSKSDQALAKARNEEGADETPTAPTPAPDNQDPPETYTQSQLQLRATLSGLTQAQTDHLRTWWTAEGLPALVDLSDEHVAMIQGHIEGVTTPDPQ